MAEKYLYAYVYTIEHLDQLCPTLSSYRISQIHLYIAGFPLVDMVLPPPTSNLALPLYNAAVDFCACWQDILQSLFRSDWKS